MILVFGGAFNGKLDFVKEKFKIHDNEIFYCTDRKIDFSKKVICGLHKFTYYNSLNNIDSLEIISNNIDLLKDKIIICDEICNGIVPLKKEERIWREDTGKVMQYLSKNSDKVFRVFCGIESKIK